MSILSSTYIQFRWACKILDADLLEGQKKKNCTPPPPGIRGFEVVQLLGLGVIRSGIFTFPPGQILSKI